MSKTYRARLHGDRIEWLGESPPRSADDTPVEIDVLVLEKRAKSVAPVPACEPPDFSNCEDPEKSKRIYEALTRLEAATPKTFPEDASAWQRETRKDRVLYGREDDA